jgi:hypothetical protein
MASASGEFIMGGVQGHIEAEPRRSKGSSIKPAIRRALEIRREKQWLESQLEDTFSEGTPDLEELGW